MPSAIVIAQSIAKVLAPMCFQNEECVLEHVLHQHAFKMHWKSKNASKKCSKTGALFQNTLPGLTHSYNNSMFLGMKNILLGPS